MDEKEALEQGLTIKKDRVGMSRREESQFDGFRGATEREKFIWIGLASGATYLQIIKGLKVSRKEVARVKRELLK